MQPKGFQQGTGHIGQTVLMHVMLLRGRSLCTSTAELRAPQEELPDHLGTRQRSFPSEASADSS